MSAITEQVNLRARLEEINEGSIAYEVAQVALSYRDEDIDGFFKDLSRNGCISGMVSGLIYYYETHEFYDKYYDEIESLRMDLEEQLDHGPRIHGDLKNWYAWFAFEKVAFNIIDGLSICK